MAAATDDLAHRVVAKMLERDRFSEWLGIKVVKIESGTAQLEMLVRDEMLNGFDVAHGAIPFALADSAVAFAANGYGRVSMSIENSMSYPAAIRVGKTLVATATELHLSNRLGVYDVRIVTKEDELVGLFRGTVYRTEKSFFEQTN